MSKSILTSVSKEFENFTRIGMPCFSRVNDMNKGNPLFKAELHLSDVRDFNELCNNKNIIISNLHPTVPLDINYFQIPFSWYGIYSGTTKFTNGLPEMDFCCFINRFDVIRQSWLYQFVRRDLFHRGFISFNMNTRSFSSPHDIFQQQFTDFLSIFNEEHEKIKDLVPYKNFSDDCLLADIIIKSKFSVILETCAFQNEMITFSEKTFRNLRLPRPWVLYTSCNGVRFLHDAGFDVLYDIVDHDYYDKTESCIERQSKILDLCETLCDLDYTDSLITRLESAAAINNQRLNDLLISCEHDVNQTLLLAEECLKNQNRTY
jgi:hypothetical protein